MRIVFVTDSHADRLFFGPLLAREGHDIVFTDFAPGQHNMLEGADFTVLDPNFETGNISQFMDETRGLTDKSAVIVISPVEREKLNIGADFRGSFLRKPFHMKEFLYLLGTNTAAAQLQPPEILRDGDFMAASPSMKAVYELVKQVAPTDASILITGETGTGKEVVARLLHSRSKRSAGDMVAINCAAIPEQLLESELFGYEKGAFTGASNGRPGKFEYADGSTIFLDEIGDMALNLQSKVLRVIQEKTVERLGSNVRRNADARIIAATNKDLESMIKEKAFREDLYYRLNVITLHLPPLRERKDDILMFANEFLRSFAAKYDKNAGELSEGALNALTAYAWPGNIRELQNLMESLVILSRNRIITENDIPVQIRPIKTRHKETTLPPSDEHDLKSLEKKAILAALLESGGNKAKAAEILGISRRTLYNKIDRYDID